MLGQRKFGLMWLSAWPESLAMEFADIVGPFRLLSEGDYFVGLDRNSTVFTIDQRINAPLDSTEINLKSSLVASRCLTSDAKQWLEELPRRFHPFNQSASPSSRFQGSNVSIDSIWYYVNLLSTIGFRFPTELEWEASLLQCRCRAEYDAKQSFVSALASAQEPIVELTYSVGFHKDATTVGTNLEEYDLDVNMNYWPGMILRGRMNVDDHVLSRFSHRYGFDSMRCRPLLELEYLKQMADCDFKQILKSYVSAEPQSYVPLLREYS